MRLGGKEDSRQRDPGSQGLPGEDKLRMWWKQSMMGVQFPHKWWRG